MPGSLALQVLLLDDNPMQLQMRGAVLREAGFSVACAGTAEEALALLPPAGRDFPVDVIVTDHILPGLTGSNFVRRVRELSPALPIIVISGMSEAEGEYAGLNITFLRKPCPPESLIKHLRAASGT